MKLHFGGVSQNPMPFLLWLEFFLEILQVPHQNIVLHTCPIWETWNNFNLIILVKMVCCIFNGTQCISSWSYLFSWPIVWYWFFFPYCKKTDFNGLANLVKTSSKYICLIQDQNFSNPVYCNSTCSRWTNWRKMHSLTYKKCLNIFFLYMQRTVIFENNFINNTL